MSKEGKRLVIDTSIARSAGGELAHDIDSIRCRAFLTAVIDNKHVLVMTDAIHDEWSKHQSNFARTWLLSMQARRLVRRVVVPADDKLRKKIDQAAAHSKNLDTIQKNREAMLKDALLIEAALLTDKIVASRDETVRHCFHEATSTIVVIKQIIWVNPCKDDEKVIEWLERGAEREQERCLGYNKDTE